MVALDICGSSGCKVLHITLLITISLRWLLDFSKSCAHLLLTTLTDRVQIAALSITRLSEW